MLTKDDVRELIRSERAAEEKRQFDRSVRKYERVKRLAAIDARQLWVEPNDLETVEEILAASIERLQIAQEKCEDG